MEYESPITYHSKDMANVKVLADRQTDRQTDGQAKNYMPPIRGHKKTGMTHTGALPQFNLPLHSITGKTG
jgi:hypothetical protein